MVNPTGDNVVPVRTPVTAAIWVRIDNPNMALQVDLVSTVAFYVRYEQFQPAPGAIGFEVPAGVIYGYSSGHTLGWSKPPQPVYHPTLHPTFSPVWVRLVAAGPINIDSNWVRE